MIFAPRALGRAEDALSRTLASLGARGTDFRQYVVVRDEQQQECARLRAGGLAGRGARRMPSVEVIAEQHGWAADTCWRCQERGVSLERVHLIDRCYGGLDAPQNLALLCNWCHKSMPTFEPGSEAEALAYAKANCGSATAFKRLLERPGSGEGA